MRRFGSILVVSAALAILAVSAAQADSFTVVRTSAGFPSNDTVNWGALGIGVRAPDGTNVLSSTGFMTTSVTFGLTSTTGRAGQTFCGAPGAGCTWNGNFAAMASLISNTSPRTGNGQGAFDLTFSQGIANVGFDIQPMDLGTFKYVVEALDGSTVLGMFFGQGMSNLTNGYAVFFGLEDLTGADITGIKIGAYQCGHDSDSICAHGFAIGNLLVQDTTTPEPASLLLFGSGFGILALLRRKFARAAKSPNQ
ncbi:MAG TPA: PEP-CTERM sorting domain-containing protein [Terriglobia bacterium]|nr:PEP-CTERM sorting domain-containing protein [Terriglobia bacterium]